MKHLALVVALGACGGLDNADLAGDPGIGGDGAGGLGGGSGSSSGQGGTQPEPGQLTAGEWDDNLNFDVFTNALATSFKDLVPKASLEVDDRIVLTLTDANGHPLSSARVDLVDTSLVDTSLVRTGESFVAGTDGRVMLLPHVDGFAPQQVALHVTALNGASATIPAATGTYAVADGTCGQRTGLDLAFVVDATGSMGDEITYLQSEMQNIALRAATEHPGVSIRFALIVYRDVVDPYVTRVFDFTTDLAAFDANLEAQSADGGGDYPEAAEVAMQKAMGTLSWRTGNVARVLFHIADAPPHDPNWGDYLATTTTARERGIRIFPVAASGAALEAEYLMRTAAVVTMGRYDFLTDDSGIGDSHEPPHIPCYLVEHLNDLLVRTIASELAGHYIAPRPVDVLDTVGNWVDGKCLPDNGRHPAAPITGTVQ